MQIKRIYFDVDMRNAFAGLKNLLALDKINAQELSEKSCVIFINRAQTQFKMLVGQDYLVCRNNGKKKIDPRVVKHFPEAFNGTTLDFNKAVRGLIEAKYGKATKS